MEDTDKADIEVPPARSVAVNHASFVRCRHDLRKHNVVRLYLYKCLGVPCTGCLRDGIQVLSVINCAIDMFRVPDTVRVLHLSGLPPGCRVLGRMPALEVLIVYGVVDMPDLCNKAGLIIHQFRQDPILRLPHVLE